MAEKPRWISAVSLPSFFRARSLNSRIKWVSPNKRITARPFSDFDISVFVFLMLLVYDKFRIFAENNAGLVVQRIE